VGSHSNASAKFAQGARNPRPIHRATWLRKQRAPEDLIQFWLGHAKQSVTDGYSKLAEDVEFGHR
jgi:integrase